MTWANLWRLGVLKWAGVKIYFPWFLCYLDKKSLTTWNIYNLPNQAELPCLQWSFLSSAVTLLLIVSAAQVSVRANG